MPNRTKQPAARVALRWQIVALVAFTVCIAALLLAGGRGTGTSAEPGSTGAGAATSAPAVPKADGPGMDAGGVVFGDVTFAQTEEGATTPAAATGVLTLVIAGVSGTGGFLSGVAALLTVRRGARRAGQLPRRPRRRGGSPRGAGERRRLLRF
jgi:hypothetical protein